MQRLVTMVISGLVRSRERRPEVARGARSVNAFISESQRLFVKHVALKPNLGRQRCADLETATRQRASIDKHFKFESAHVEIDPIEFATGQRIAQRFEGDDATAKNPIV